MLCMDTRMTNDDFKTETNICKLVGKWANLCEDQNTFTDCQCSQEGMTKIIFLYVRKT